MHYFVMYVVSWGQSSPLLYLLFQYQAQAGSFKSFAFGLQLLTHMLGILTNCTKGTDGGGMPSSQEFHFIFPNPLPNPKTSLCKEDELHSTILTVRETIGDRLILFILSSNYVLCHSVYHLMLLSSTSFRLPVGFVWGWNQESFSVSMMGKIQRETAAQHSSSLRNITNYSFLN